VLELGTVDDVFLVVSATVGVGRRRNDLRKLAALTESLDAARLLAPIESLRTVPRPVRFDVVGSFLGRRNFNRYEIEDAVGGGVAAVTAWRYESRAGGRVPERTGLSFRVHLAGEEATLAARLAARPLHRRAYRASTRPGSLHPPLARVMALLAGIGEGALLVDPFTGAGTIPIEAELTASATVAVGFDIDPSAVVAAGTNATAAGVRARFAIADASSLPVESGSVNCVVTNPPWGAAVPLKGRLHRDLGAAWQEVARILRADGRAVVIAPAEADVVAGLRRVGLEPVVRNPVRVSGAEAEVVVFAREASTGAGLADPRRSSLVFSDQPLSWTTVPAPGPKMVPVVT
jgi:tRNA (guanine6-N2)-methyltransferase